MSDEAETGLDYEPIICGVFRERVLGDLRYQTVYDQYGVLWGRLVYQSKIAQLAPPVPDATVLDDLAKLFDKENDNG